MKILLVFILFNLNCINVNKDPRLFKISHPEFHYYISKFHTYYKIHSNIPINFLKLEDGTNGICHTWGTEWKEIHISPDFWSQASELQKTNLIFHELGHCELSRDHLNKFLSDSCPSSFMYERTISDFCLKKHWGKYIKEL